ncbi:uncharacterized protein LOC120928242 [Rana temporaria]|uniref:uncharacterized protein LOC120928242 n=1 Tax=Rana temporaria TaxID=8407 RepID=UPI001AADFB06|nr:uncharacterized protein LOC120928242 [Rana temporaria]
MRSYKMRSSTSNPWDKCSSVETSMPGQEGKRTIQVLMETHTYWAMQITTIQNQRNSYDSTTNKDGRKLLNVHRSLGLYILNGRTKGDSLGRYTFSSHVGSSVVDYAITDMNPTLINGFTVTPQTHLSDHNQLLLYIKSSSKPSPKLHRASLRNLPPSFKWSKQSTTKYREVTDRPDIKKQLENFQNTTYEISPPGVNQAAKDFHTTHYCRNSPAEENQLQETIQQTIQ